MTRFAAIFVWCLAGTALASPAWNETLQDLKSIAASGDRAQVAEKLQAAYKEFDSSEKIKSQILTWGAELLEIFNTQKGLNDFERAKSLSDLEPDLAVELLQRSLESEPNHPKVLAQLTDIHLRRREVGRAKPLVQKLLSDYPLWRPTYFYQLRLLSADPAARQLEELAADKEQPFSDFQVLAGLMLAAHKKIDGLEKAGVSKELEQGLEQFPDWPEITYLAFEHDEAQKQKWAAKFLAQCSGGAGAALPKYPSAICQRVDQVEELVSVKPEGM